MTEDWRLTWEDEWMYAARLQRRAFTAPTPDWDHEHCALCQETFMEPPHEGVLHEGLVWGYDRSRELVPLDDRTADYPPGGSGRIAKAPTVEQWICETCFEDFKPRFGWSAESVGEDTSL
ncbi:MAG TPA: hypothetical protein VFA34_15675 [Actinomycetota bacterium]|jgi:hypothetical protein|nr:hypothetical protein [Actinomycetota bacterium]